MIPLSSIAEFAKVRPSAIAVEDRDRALTWAEFEEETRRILPALDAALPADRARVMMDVEASAEVFVVAAALATLGVPWVALDPSKPAEVRHAQMDVLASDGVVRVVDGNLTLTDLSWREPLPLGRAVPKAVDGQPQRREFQALGFTSGTTGMPKMVLRTSPSEARRNAYLIDRFRFSPEDRFLLCLPLSHASGHGWARTYLTAGATVVIVNDDLSAISDAILNRGITGSLLVPPVLAGVVAKIRMARGEQEADTRMRFLLTGGRHLSRSLIGEAFATLGPVLHAYYGTTETGVNAIAEPFDLLADMRSSGRPLPGCSIVILDHNSVPVAAGTPGRIAIASYMNAHTYHSGPIPGVQIAGELYLLTVDTGFLAPDGRLVVLGRIAEALSAEDFGDLVGLEDDAKLLCGIHDVAVTASAGSGSGIDDVGPHIKVFVTRERTKSLDDALVQYLITKLARQCGVRVPVLVSFVPQLQFNTTGKFDMLSTLQSA